MRYLIDCVYLLGLVLVSPKALYRIIVHKRYRSGWAQRLGRVRRRRPEASCVWIHAVSVGEVNATRTILQSLRQQRPDCEIVISATTDTGLARARTLYAEQHEVFYFPFDLSCVVSRALRSLRPNAILLMELEIWPNLVRQAHRRGIAVLVVNGRISDRSFPRYRLIRPLMERLFSRISRVLAQSEEYAERFVALGCPADRVEVTRSLKYDTAEMTDRVEGTDALARQLSLDRDPVPVWIAGGTGPGEEALVLDVHRRLLAEPGLERLCLAIVPRKPERFDEVAGSIGQTGLSYARYSRLKAGTEYLESAPQVILGDTMGDLRKFYCLATGPVFVGRSLVPMGGSDMMEPAALGKCTIFGPHTFNFRQTVQALLEGGGAIEVGDAEQLFQALRRCLSDTEYTLQISRNGRDVIRRNQGATERTVAVVLALLNRQEPPV